MLYNNLPKFHLPQAVTTLLQRESLYKLESFITPESLTVEFTVNPQSYVFGRTAEFIIRVLKHTGLATEFQKFFKDDWERVLTEAIITQLVRPLYILTSFDDGSRGSIKRQLLSFALTSRERFTNFGLILFNLFASSEESFKLSHSYGYISVHLKLKVDFDSLHKLYPYLDVQSKLPSPYYNDNHVLVLTLLEEKLKRGFVYSKWDGTFNQTLPAIGDYFEVANGKGGYTGYLLRAEGQSVFSVAFNHLFFIYPSILDVGPESPPRDTVIIPRVLPNTFDSTLYDVTVDKLYETVPANTEKHVDAENYIATGIDMELPRYYTFFRGGPTTPPTPTEGPKGPNRPNQPKSWDNKGRGKAKPSSGPNIGPSSLPEQGGGSPSEGNSQSPSPSEAIKLITLEAYNTTMSTPDVSSHSIQLDDEDDVEDIVNNNPSYLKNLAKESAKAGFRVLSKVAEAALTSRLARREIIQIVKYGFGSNVSLTPTLITNLGLNLPGTSPVKLLKN